MPARNVYILTVTPRPAPHRLCVYRSNDVRMGPGEYEARWDWTCNSGHPEFYLPNEWLEERRTWAEAFESARRHARDVHGVTL